MDLYEYQGKQYFTRFDIPVSDGDVADTVEEAVVVAERYGYPVTIKAQVLVGGRGKAGGVKLAFNKDEAETHARNILGLDIKGHIVHRLWIERSSDIEKEYYASFTLDRGAKLDVLMLCAQGGIEIEQVAEEDPDAITKLFVNPVDGLGRADLEAAIATAGIDAEARSGVADVIMKLYRCYIEGDAELVEINPLILTPDGRVHALDAKVSLDDASAFRHPDWEAFENLEELDHREQLAHEKGLQYVGLDGYVGIIANGAGLAMSTCDVVEQVGGEPANFLDIGGGANADKMASALEVINTDEKVRAIFINIFGGITRGDEVANGIVQALERVDIDVPIVVRLDGTKAEEGRAILKGHESDSLISLPTMIDAARKAAELAKAAK